VKAPDNLTICLEKLYNLTHESDVSKEHFCQELPVHLRHFGSIQTKTIEIMKQPIVKEKGFVLNDLAEKIITHPELKEYNLAMEDLRVISAFIHQASCQYDPNLQCIDIMSFLPALLTTSSSSWIPFKTLWTGR